MGVRSHHEQPDPLPRVLPVPLTGRRLGFGLAASDSEAAPKPYAPSTPLTPLGFAGAGDCNQEHTNCLSVCEELDSVWEKTCSALEGLAGEICDDMQWDAVDECNMKCDIDFCPV